MIPLWLLTVVYVAVSFILGLTLPRLEVAYSPHLGHDISVSSAQALLASIASGMMSLTAIVFSIGFVVSQLSATAYSPRLTVELSRNPLVFHSLGIFTGTFIYALSVLAWIDRAGTSGGIPTLSAKLAIVFVIVSMVFLALLVRTMQNLNIVYILRFIERRGHRSIEELQRQERPAEMVAANNAFPEAPATQTLIYTGPPLSVGHYDIALLVEQARRADAVIVLDNAVGDSVVNGSRLLRVCGGTAPLPDQRLRRAVHLTDTRTFRQDPKFAFRLLVDIAIRALSPAINDPTTAVQALDQIEDLLGNLGRRPTGYVRDDTGTVRVVFPTPAWDDYLALAFDEIRQYGSGSVQVLRRLRAALARLSQSIADPTRKEAVQRYIRRLDDTVTASSFDADDRTMALQEDPQGIGLSRRLR